MPLFLLLFRAYSLQVFVVRAITFEISHDFFWIEGWVGCIVSKLFWIFIFTRPLNRLERVTCHCSAGCCTVTVMVTVTVSCNSGPYYYADDLYEIYMWSLRNKSEIIVKKS